MFLKADAIFKNDYDKEQTLHNEEVFVYDDDEDNKKKNFPYAFLTCFLRF